MSFIEFKRLLEEWRTRLHRVQQILSPPQWSEADWNRFSRALYILVKKYGTTWQSDSQKQKQDEYEESKGQPEHIVHYWDVRWSLREGGELICQVEEEPAVSRRSILVAQSGGFAKGREHYTWFYGEFNEHGSFIGTPYWVDGNWKEALSMILLPQQVGAGFYLTGGGVSNQSAPLLGYQEPASTFHASQAAHASPTSEAEESVEVSS